MVNMTHSVYAARESMRTLIVTGACIVLIIAGLEFATLLYDGSMWAMLPLFVCVSMMMLIDDRVFRAQNEVEKRSISEQNKRI